MSLEVELKVLGIKPESVKKKLEEMRVLTRKIDQRDFVILPSGKEVLRVRKVDGKVKLTWKYRVEKSKFKVARETEVEVSDYDKMKRILFRMCKGLPYYEYEKIREVFELNGVKGEIVKLEGLAPYLELEGEREKIMEVIKMLGLENKETSSDGIPSLLRKVGIMPKKIE